MTNLGTTIASTNDTAGAYTHIECDGRSFEIRHPRAGKSWQRFEIFRWNDTVGHVHFRGGFDTLEEAITCIGSQS